MPYLRAQRDHAASGGSVFYAAQTDFAEKFHAGGGEFFEVIFDHALFENGRTGVDLHSTGAKGVEGALRENRHRFQADDIFGAAGSVDFSGGNHRRDTAVQATVDPAQLILARRPVAADGMHVAVD